MSDPSPAARPGTPTTLPQKAFRAWVGKRMDALASLPGPTPSFPLGNAQDFLGRLPWEVCAEYAERYGGMVRVWFFGSPTLVLTEPELVWQVLEGDFDNYYKGPPRKQFLPILTDASEFIANGAAWAERRAADPANNAHGPRGYEFDPLAIRESLTRRARAYVETTRDAPLGDVFPALLRLSFDTLSIQAVGQELGDEAFHTFSTLMEVGNTRLNAPVYPPFALTGARAHARWQAGFAAHVQQARRTPGSGRSMLHATLQAGTRLDDAALAAQLGNIFFGGMTSITSGVLSTLYLLTRHPDVRERVVAELRALADLTPEALEGCQELKRVVLESLRVLPPVPIYARRSNPTREVSLGGQVLPPDTNILLTCWPLHRSARHWKDPERFEPSRWQGTTLEQNPLGSGYYFPFGRGRRSCAGSRIGLLNIQLILAALLVTCRPEVGAGQPYVGRFFHGTMLPKGMSARFLSV